MEERDLSKFYVWFDTEYTSLELDRARLIQVAMIVTDSEGRRVGNMEDDLVQVVRLPSEEPVSDWLKTECPALVEACRSESAPCAVEVDRLLAGRLDLLLGPAPTRVSRRPYLAGNSIHNDWFLARRDLPQFSARLHYRHLDVTSLKILWLNSGAGPEFEKEKAENILDYFPDAGLDGASTRHDALYDVKASIAEMNFYRRNFLRSFQSSQ